jgi:hypothetical protein
VGAGAHREGDVVTTDRSTRAAEHQDCTAALRASVEAQEVLARSLAAVVGAEPANIVRVPPPKRARGVYRDSEYRSWDGLIRRCTCSAEPSWHNYGGRGITVCERWLSYENFLADMGPKPSRKHSLDRIDVNGNYEPGNCRWATVNEQQRNRRNNKLVTFGSKTQCLTAWAEELHLPLYTLSQRLNRGWSVEKAFTEPVNQTRASHAHQARYVVAHGESLSLSEWARRLGTTSGTIAGRLDLGWPAERAVTEPVRPMKPMKPRLPRRLVAVADKTP